MDHLKIVVRGMHDFLVLPVILNSGALASIQTILASCPIVSVALFGVLWCRMMGVF